MAEWMPAQVDLPAGRVDPQHRHPESKREKEEEEKKNNHN